MIAFAEFEWCGWYTYIYIDTIIIMILMVYEILCTYMMYVYKCISILHTWLVGDYNIWLGFVVGKLSAFLRESSVQLKAF